MELIDTADFLDEYYPAINRTPTTEYDDIIQYELHGGTVSDWIDDVLEKTAREQVRKEMEFFNDLWRIYTARGDQKRSLAALVHTTDPTKKVIYKKYEDGYGLIWTILDIVDNEPPDISNHHFAGDPPSAMIKNDLGQLVREFHDNTAEESIRRINKKQQGSEFKRFVSKRRK